MVEKNVQNSAKKTHRGSNFRDVFVFRGGVYNNLRLKKNIFFSSQIRLYSKS